MSAIKKKLTAALLGVALVGVAPSGCGSMASNQGHSPGDTTVVAASGR
jgi:hypothetical protein